MLAHEQYEIMTLGDYLDNFLVINIAIEYETANMHSEIKTEACANVPIYILDSSS